MRSMLTRIELRGYKTFADLSGERAITMSRLNILIGPNGAGKSNFISLFRFLSWALASPGKLQEYISRQDGASKILTDGPEHTRDLSLQLQIETDAGRNDYAFHLAYAANDTLIYTEEKFRFSRREIRGDASWQETDGGHREAQIIQKADGGDKTAKTILNLLRKMVVYQFHNTSDTARIRQKWGRHDSRYLREDGANLVPVLLRLRDHKPPYYRRIVDMIRLILPFFDDFDLEPEYDNLLLRWKERATDRIFVASQAGDGMLRVMALVTLLLLPDDELPDVLILDEPELGLHPYAIGIVGGLIRSVATKIQVVLATQSLPLVDCFDPEDIVVVERGVAEDGTQGEGRYSRLIRLNRDSLQSWLEEYSLSELWEKNVIGGRP